MVNNNESNSIKDDDDDFENQERMTTLKSPTCFGSSVATSEEGEDAVDIEDVVEVMEAKPCEDNRSTGAARPGGIGGEEGAI